MNLAGAAIFLCWITALGAVLLGLVVRPRRVPLRVLLFVTAAVVALFSAIGAWYAWTESRSTTWTLGYALLALLGSASAIRQVAGRARSAQNP
jgi:predicted membrane channel-forming protein YqfA (hemolysin III family)